MSSKKKSKKPSNGVKAQKPVLSPSLTKVPIPAAIPQNKNYLALAFIFPFIILGTMFAINRIYPFGNQAIIVRDFGHQYLPFLSDYWHKIRGGSFASWSWTSGMGSDYIALFAYYMASPLNLLAILTPRAALMETLTVILLIKIGLSGLFMGIYLRYAFGNNGPALPFFSSLYALCAFSLGYYYNIMWFDSFALLPLVICGLLALMREGKYRLYIISLALAVLTNYYIGFFICVFTAITFFSQCIISGYNRNNFLSKLALVAVSSIIAIALTAVLTVPAFFSLKITYTAISKFPEKLATFNSFASVLGNLIAFTPPTVINGLPNLYSGMISIMLAAVFIRSPKILRREKILFLGTAVFFILSCNLNILDYLWNGLHYTNSLPFRFSFLLSFTIVGMAFRTFLLIKEKSETKDRKNILAMGISAAFFLLMAIIGSQKIKYILGSTGLSLLYLIVLDFYLNGKNKKQKSAANIIVLALIFIEISVSAFNGIKTNSTSNRDNYPDSYSNVQELLGRRSPAGAGFYRTELANRFVLNDPALYNYNGISFFSSTAGVGVTKFLTSLGLKGWDIGNRYIYAETTPLTNAFLNLRYMIGRNIDVADSENYWRTVALSGNSTLLENKKYLPLGFMVNNELGTYVNSEENPFLSQNDFFMRATGLGGRLFTIRDLTLYFNAVKDSNGKTLIRWDFEMPEDGMIYAYCKINNIQSMIIAINNTGTRAMDIDLPYIFPIGYYEKGVIVSLFADEDAVRGNPFICIGLMDTSLFERGYEILSSSPLELDYFSQTKISGLIAAKKDGLLYTSIPYDAHWTAKVDGIKKEILPVGGAMAALKLDEGTHRVELKYNNKNMNVGIIISLISLVLFIALSFLDGYLRKKKAKRDNYV